MKRRATALIAVFALTLATSAAAMVGYLVNQDTTTVAGTMYIVCTYDVGGTRVDKLLRFPATCPMSINM